MFKAAFNLITRKSIAKKPFSSGRLTTSYKPKTEWEVWTGDKATYPLIGVVLFDGLLILFAVTYISITSPDVHFNPSDRHTFFRGELKGFEHIGRD